MREKSIQIYRYARLVVKFPSLIFILLAIAVFGVQILQIAMKAGRGWIVLFFVGFAFWLADSLWTKLKEMDEVEKEIKSHRQSSK
jgi:hypothetical protein